MKGEKAFKRLFALILCAAMFITYMPSAAFANTGEAGDKPAAANEKMADTQVDDKTPADEVKDLDNAEKQGGDNQKEAGEAGAKDAEKADEVEAAAEVNTSENNEGDKPATLGQTVMRALKAAPLKAEKPAGYFAVL